MILDGYFYPVDQWLDKIHKVESTGEYEGFSVDNYIVGNRQGGKTVGVGIMSIGDYLCYGYKSVLVRRFEKHFRDAQKPAMESFWLKAWPHKAEFKELVHKVPKLQKLYPLEIVDAIDWDAHQIEFKEGHRAFIDGELFCYPASLNLFDDYKQADYFNVHNILYDEFVSENGERLSNEVEALNNLYDSFARNRDDALETTAIIYMSNSITDANQFFTEMGIDREIRKDTKKLKRPEKAYTYEKVFNQVAADKVANSAFGKKLMAGPRGRDYLGYSQGNEVKDDTSFVQTLKGDFHYIVNFRIDGKVYALKQHTDTRLFYFTDDKVDKNFHTCFALTMDDHTQGTFLINLEVRKHFAIYKSYYQSGYMRFNSMRSKNVFMEVYRYL